MTRNSPFRAKSWPVHLTREFVRFLRKQRISILSTSPIEIGLGVTFGENVDIRAPNKVVIGNYVGLGKNFTAEVDFEIGCETLISSNVSFIGNQHMFDDPNSSVYWQGRVDKDFIKLEGNNLVGFGSIIVGNVTIGRGAIVGAGSVVTRSLPPNMICVGTPARPIRKRFPELLDSGRRNA
jgi:chloramphenicol O-acetyltransferase type B